MKLLHYYLEIRAIKPLNERPDEMNEQIALAQHMSNHYRHLNMIPLSVSIITNALEYRNINNIVGLLKYYDSPQAYDIFYKEFTLIG